MKKLLMLLLLVISIGACSSTEPAEIVAAPTPQPAAPPVQEAQVETPAPVIEEPPVLLRPAPRAAKPKPVVQPTVAPAAPEPRTPTWAERNLPGAAPPPPFVADSQPALDQPVLPVQPVVKQPQIRQLTIPAGTTIFVRLIDTIDSETDRVGQKYQASLEAPVEVGGQVVLGSDADVYLKLIEVKSANRVTGRSEVRVQLDRIEAGGKTYIVDSSVHHEQAESRSVDTAKKAGIGAAIGTAVGAISGGGKGAILGGILGAGGGVGVQAISKGEQVRIESESLLDFRLEQPVTVEKIVKEM